ncbi:MAG: hypothetical protein H6873_02250 [Hyphomicrobiaceae bacterium]|nr:hypothetical protein [Hyphomicrobiaceae bacterium]
MFDEKTKQALQYYVYALFDPDGRPFYVGKGFGDRVFSHVQGALDEPAHSLKYDTIRSILAGGNEVRHLIIRHGMDESTAFQVESALIDFSEASNMPLSNMVLGHNSIDCGLMSTDEIIRKYNAEKLVHIYDPVVIININRTYQRDSGGAGIYEATRKYWVISEFQRNRVKYALAEFRGLIAEVYEIDSWYPADEADSKRWAFHGRVAADEVRNRYINRSIAYAKVRGAANPIRYSLLNFDYLFEKHPGQWGLGGDPQLWDEMKSEARKLDWPRTADELPDIVSNLFKRLTGRDISETSDFYIERFDRGGMQRGMVSMAFWRETALPFLIEAYSGHN